MPDGQLTILRAPVNLPGGATINEVRAYLFDNSATDDIRVELLRRTNIPSIINPMAEIGTSGSPGGVTVEDTTIINGLVDNATYHYYLEVVFDVPMSGSELLQISPIRIGYEVTSPLP